MMTYVVRQRYMHKLFWKISGFPFLERKCCTEAVLGSLALLLNGVQVNGDHPGSKGNKSHQYFENAKSYFWTLKNSDRYQIFVMF